MKFTHLPWDSDFFKIQIGKIEFDHDDKEDNLIAEIDKHANYDLLYIITPEHLVLSLPDQEPKCILVDKKILFHRSIAQDTFNPDLVVDVAIDTYTDKNVNEELVDLAYQSGEYSRFRLDPKISNSKFEQLYKLWIENSVNRSIADHVYVARFEGKIVGMITIKNDRDTATIGLFSVDQKMRGRKVGSALLNYSLVNAKQMGVEEVFVPTQVDNVLACKFYEKNKFKKHTITNIYHNWLK